MRLNSGSRANQSPTLLIKRASQRAKKGRFRSTWLNVTRVVSAAFSGSIPEISVLYSLTN
jgi:hypothetical protein